MPIFPGRPCAFVHIPKTAGRSVLSALTAGCGDPSFADRGLWGLLKERDDRAELVTSLRANFRLSTLRDFPQQHMPAAMLRSVVGAGAWNDLFTFAFVRNPWDLVVSTYHFSRAFTVSNPGIDPDLVELHALVPNFDAFVEMYPVVRSDMSAMLCDESGAPLVDFIGRYESLAADFSRVSERLGISIELPHTNRSEHPDYRSCYTGRTRAIVQRHFARDIERFGYAF